MPSTVLRGRFVIRYPDLPRQGPEPDGDTVKFVPDTPALVEGLPRRSGRPPKVNARGVSVRLEAIDALETHFDETHQELSGANDARDELLARLGFTGAEFFPDLPNKVRAADQDSMPGHVLSNGVDANGRLIGFVYPGGASRPGRRRGVRRRHGGGRLGQRPAARRRAGVSGVLRDPAGHPAHHLADTSRAARTAGAGLWPRSTADPDGAATVTGLPGLQELVLWPKLFRRIVPYLASGHADFDGFQAWLRAVPVNRDDAVFLLDRLEAGNLHDVIRAQGDRIQFTAWLEDFIIDPDPAPLGTPTGPRPATTGQVLILAALPDPEGTDRGHETVTLINTMPAPVDLTGWNWPTPLAPANPCPAPSPGRHPPDHRERPGASRQRGDSIVLQDPTGATIDQVTYKQDQVRSGHTICFGRTS